MSELPILVETAAERCPIVPGGATRLHWSFLDPAGFTGTWEERLVQTRQVRDAIRHRIEAWITSLADEKESCC